MIKLLKVLQIKRSLKEQEQLLENCIQSSEINKSSMCETIYEEKEQVISFLCVAFYNTSR